LTQHDLGELGWQPAFADPLEPHQLPARVVAQHRGQVVVRAEHGELRVRLPGRFRYEGLDVAVGDWLAIAGDGVVQAVLPRRSAIVRDAAGLATAAQILAANVDVAFVVSSLGPDLEPRRLERFLVSIWESGASPEIVLTKADRLDDPWPLVAEVEEVALGVPVHVVSAVTGQGCAALRARLLPGTTAVLLGSSGVGKSTLVNVLAGRDVLATQEVRADDHRGRHTTTHRQLLVLPGGGVVLDTPGIRELQLWDADLGQAFSDVEEVAARCRFADCRHAREPGCAVRAALADGSLPADRWQSYVKLQRELAALEVRRNHLLRQEQVRESKIRERASRRRKRR